MSPREQTIERIRSVLIRALSVEIDEDALREVDRLDRVIAMDSIAALEFVVGLESEFGVTLDSDRLDLEFLGDVQRLAAYLEKRSRDAGRP
jgi:acyl carrier protein